MHKTALITGIAGQDGSYLAEWLLRQGYRVHGVTGPIGPLADTPLRDLTEQLQLHEVDLLQESAIAQLVDRIQPDEFYNLAARSFVPDSFSAPAAVAELNALAVLHMLEAIRKVNRNIRFFQASSSQCFGQPRQTPQDEETPFSPRNPYAAAKAHAHWVTVHYRETHALFACCGILFNHESPRRGLEFVTRKIAHGAARIKLGLDSELRLGNLQAVRDWGYAGDFVQAMWQMLQQDSPDDFVIGTGVGHSVEDFVRLAFAHVGLDWRDHVSVAAEYYRPEAGLPVIADATKARRLLPWTPTVGFADLVALAVDAELQRLVTQAGSSAAVRAVAA